MKQIGRYLGLLAVSMVPWSIYMAVQLARLITGGFTMFYMVKYTYYSAVIIIPVSIISTMFLFMLILPRVLPDRQGQTFSTKEKRSLSLILGLTAFAPLLLYLYATHIEPRAIQVEEVTIPVNGLNETIKVAHLSDIQSMKPGRYEERVLKMVADMEPDLVIHTGDLVQVCERGEYLPAVRKISRWLAAIDPPLGIFHVMGDTDHPALVKEFEPFPGMNILQNSGITLRTSLGTPVYLFGLTLAGSRERRLPGTGLDRWLDTVSGPVRLVAGHAPDFMLEMDSRGETVCFAGHTHGGQVRLPFAGPIITLSDVPDRWARGFHRGQGFYLNVSAGIGAEHAACLPSIRFLCPPEFTVITLVPSN
jgi:predicted MPP superfamily phosphohydrolase